MCDWEPYGQHEEEIYSPDVPCELRARRFNRIQLIAPSDVAVGQEFDVSVVAIGEDGDIDEDYCGSVSFLCSDIASSVPDDCTVHQEDKGVRVFRGFSLAHEGLHMLEVKPTEGPASGSSQCLRGCASKPDRRTFWGDLHFHTRLSDGSHTPKEGYTSARDIFRLDFAAAADHDMCHGGQSPLGRSGNPGPDSEIYDVWPDVINNARDFYDPGRFVTFPAYEWSSAGGAQEQAFGHRNVYFRDDDVPIYPHTRYRTPLQLWAALREAPGVGNAMTVAHHSILDRSSGTDWRYYDADFERLVEVYSQFGSSEYYGNPRPVSSQRRDRAVLSALMRGYRIGLMSSSDNHTGKVGSGHSLVPAAYPRGLVAVSARDLTRESVWEALWNRRCYGASDGERILMDFRVNDMPMGSEIVASGPPFLSWEVGAGQPLSSIKVVKYDGRDVTATSFSSLDSVHRGGFEDSEFSGKAFYYLKVIMSDGAMAWAGPIWVASERQ